ncbi:MAG: ATP synthase F1 subunit delta [Bacteroidales bacterium]
MNDSKISVRYAKALFESALENEILEQVRNDMVEIQTISRVPEFQKLLDSRIIKESEKNRIVEELLKNRTQSLTMSLLSLLIKNGREQYIPAIARNYGDLFRHHTGIKAATFITAAPVSDMIKERVEKVFKEAMKSELEMLCESNEDLIGGFIVRVDNRQYDASVASSLKCVKKKLLN